MNTATLLPPQGEIRGKSHLFPARVYYEDTDTGGLVYHANYLRYAERARTEMLRVLGIHQRELTAKTGMIFTVYKADVQYLKPARLDDALLVETALKEIGAASVTISQVIRRPSGDSAEDIVRFNAQIACVGPDGKPMRLPAELKTSFENYATA